MFAAILFALKAGLGLGGALSGLACYRRYGYVPNVEQTEHALAGHPLRMSVFPAIAFGLCVVCLVFYRIDKALEIQIQDELAERRKRYAHGMSDRPRYLDSAMCRLATPSWWRSCALGAMRATRPPSRTLMPRACSSASPSAAAERRKGRRRPRHRDAPLRHDHAPRTSSSGRPCIPQPDRYDFGRRTGSSRSGESTGWPSSATPSSGTADPGLGLRGQGRRAPRPGDRCSRGCASTSTPVVGRYKGRIKGWDVVNEAISDDARARRARPSGATAIGDDYIAKAFEYAHEADPAGRALLQRLQPDERPEARDRHPHREGPEGARPARGRHRRAGALADRRPVPGRHRGHDRGHRRRRRQGA